MQKVPDTFDTDAESIGDTTNHSLGSPVLSGQPQLRQVPVAEPRHHSGFDKSLPMQDSMSGVLDSLSVSKSQTKMGDNGSSVYPREYEDDQSDEPGRGDHLEDTEAGFSFLKPGESQEWSKFQENPLTQVPFALGSGTHLAASNLPQRSNSIPDSIDQVVHLQPQKQRASQTQGNASIHKLKQDMLSWGLVNLREQTPQRLSTNHSSKHNTPLAMREKPLPAAPSPDTVGLEHRSSLERTPFPLQSISETQADSKESRELGSNRTPPTSRRHYMDTSSSSRTTKGSGSLDYTPRQLARMSYSDLAKEPFDFVPGPARRVLPEDIASKPLNEKLEHLMHLSDWAEPDKSSLRANFFASLSLDDFERCGKWLSQNIGTNIMSQSSLRRRKRTASQAFEGELTNRMELIKRHKGRVEKGLRRIKVAGSDMVAGKFVKQRNTTVRTTADKYAGGKIFAHNPASIKTEMGAAVSSKARSGF